MEKVQNRNELYWEWFCSIPKLYQAHREVLLRCYETPEAIWNASAKELNFLKNKGNPWMDQVIRAKSELMPEEMMHSRRKQGIQFISCEHSCYPKRLHEIKNHPFGLFLKGQGLPNPNQKAVAIIGARLCSREGREMAQLLAGEVARANGIVISGAAYGVDGAAQWEALEQGGTSYAVVGSGVDVYYPKANELLFERLQEQGGILSEFPPGTRPLRQHFPLRNRIISGLADTVVVVEAKKNSGSLITADYAAEQGRYVMAVPGRPGDELSEGCNELISQGAGIILSPESFAEELFPEQKTEKKKQLQEIGLAPSEKLVYSSLDLHSKSLWELAECTSLSLSELSDSLVALELKGFIKEKERNYYMKMK